MFFLKEVLTLACKVFDHFDQYEQEHLALWRIEILRPLRSESKPQASIWPWPNSDRSNPKDQWAQDDWVVRLSNAGANTNPLGSPGKHTQKWV